MRRAFSIRTGGAATAERLKHFVQVVADGYFVVEEVLQPDKVHALGHRDEREQVAEAYAHVRFGGWFLFDFGRVVQL